MEIYDEAIQEILKGVEHMLKEALDHTMKGYNGAVLKESTTPGKWDVRFNGEVHSIKPYGNVEPRPGLVVKVLIPNNNLASAYFI